MKSMLGCLFSALVGGLMVVALTDSRPAGVATGQEQPRNSGPAFPGTTPLPGGKVTGKNRPRFGSTRGEEGPPADPGARPNLSSEPARDLVSLEERINIAVYETVNKSVAHITTKGIRADALFLLDLPVEGAGSGSVLDKAGHILTNYHVIEEARQVSVTLSDGKSHDAKFVGADPINDVCVIKIDAPPESLTPVVLGDSRQLKVGMRVFAIGNPFGLERTLTTGIISSLNRTLQIHNNRTIKSIIQIDAAINPGSSGGPLLDTGSRLIGMNTAIASKTGQSAGVGFAIPVNLIARIVPQLIAHGRVVRPDIGIVRVYETDHGLLIYKLLPGGPAERAGLRGPQISSKKRGPFVLETIDRSAADLIIAVDAQKVTTADDFLGYIEANKPGDVVTLTVVRQGRETQVPVQLSGNETVQGAGDTRR